MPGLYEVVDATTYRGKTPVKLAIGDITMDGILPAFQSLRKLRELSEQEQPLFSEVTKNFDEMCSKLWVAYKGRMSKAADVMGFDLGFLYQKPEKFEQGCAAFASKYPDVRPEFVHVVKSNRNLWGERLARFRNDYIEHKTLNREEVAACYQPAVAEYTFKAVWECIEDILSMLLASKLPAMIELAEISEDQRDPEFPKRFVPVPRKPLGI